MSFDFEYKITSRNCISVITFKRKITKESKDQLEKCRQAILSEDSSLVNLYFKEVPGIDATVFREVILLQQDIRKKNIPLYVTGLDNATKQYLIDRAVVRLSEFKKSLNEIFGELAKVA